MSQSAPFLSTFQEYEPLTAITTATGVVDTETVVADERVVDMSNQFKLLDPMESQFTTMLQELSGAPAIREKIEWLEDQLFPRLSSLAASAASADTTLGVNTGEGAYFRAGDLVRNSVTGECVKVTSVSTDTLTVTRAIGAVAAASSASGAQLLIVGNASTQGATLGTLKVTKRVLGFNYTQIFRRPFGFSGTHTNIELYGGNEPMKEEVKKAIEQKRAEEYAYFFGARSFTSAAPNSIGTVGGAVEFIATNIFNAAGTLTKANWEIYLTSILQHGSRNKVCFAAPVVAQAISGFSRDNWVRAQPGEKIWGTQVTAHVSGAYGDSLPVIVKRDWNDFSTASTQYGGWAFVIDMDYVRRRPLRNRDTQLLRNRQANDADTVIHEYLAETSLEFSTEKAHGIVRGVTG